MRNVVLKLNNVYFLDDIIKGLLGIQSSSILSVFFLNMYSIVYAWKNKRWKLHYHFQIMLYSDAFARRGSVLSTWICLLWGTWWMAPRQLPTHRSERDAAGPSGEHGAGNFLINNYRRIDDFFFPHFDSQMG